MGATVLGLMSGTSADGVDAVLARFDGAPRQPSWRVINAIHHPYPLPLRPPAGGGGGVPPPPPFSPPPSPPPPPPPGAGLIFIGCTGMQLWSGSRGLAKFLRARPGPSLKGGPVGRGVVTDVSAVMRGSA